MIRTRLTKWLAVVLLFATGSTTVNAAEMASTQLVYRESEPGVDTYYTRFTITDRYIRIDDLADDDGYIFFDAQEKAVYSVSHLSKLILVIPDYTADTDVNRPEARIEYERMVGAPTIEGKPVFSYRVFSSKNSELCTDIQLAEGLLPEAASILRDYMRVTSAQHVVNLDKTPDEFKTECYLIDQVFNSGEYYRKGLPIRESHSNGKIRQLEDFKKVKVEESLFELPGDYRQFTLEDRNAASGVEGPM